MSERIRSARTPACRVALCEHAKPVHTSVNAARRSACATLVFVLYCALSFRGAPTYKDVSSIFAARCYGCHAAAVKMGSLNLQTWAGFQEGGTHGKIVVPGKSAESRLYLLITGQRNARHADGRQQAQPGAD